MSGSDYRDNQIVQHNHEHHCGLDANSDEYMTMDDTQDVYEEVEQRTYGLKKSSKLDQVSPPTEGQALDNCLTQKIITRAENVYRDPKSGTKMKWHLPYSKQNLGRVLFAVTSLVVLALVVILVIIVLAKIGSLQSSMKSPLCENTRNFPSYYAFDNFSFIFSDFLVQFEQQLTGYCELEKRKFVRYQVLDADFESCSDVLNQNSSAESGYYLLRSSTGQLTSVYCDMNRSCGNITGGWMRLAELDVASCPAGLKSKIFEGIRTCVVNEDDPGCTSVSFGSYGISFSKICGQIRGYGIGTVDGIHNMRPGGYSINDNYLDGVSLSTGDFHVWSFAAGNCWCSQVLPHFITGDWTCDGQRCPGNNFCGNYLWNNTRCGEDVPFLKHLPNTTTNGIKMRVCRDEPRDNEDIALSNIELYVY